MLPKEYIKPVPKWLCSQETKFLLDILCVNGKEVRFVGGCVRDSLIQKEVSDVDIATLQSPDEIINRLENKGIQPIKVGVSYGTVGVVIGEQHYEITTLRRDKKSFGRGAIVEFIDDWEEDASRRDFTINTLSCNSEGLIFDPFDGIADLRAGRIRFVGNPAERIQEDHLRLLRFFRFFAWYGNDSIDSQALKACADSAQSLKRLSGERIRQETLKLLAAPSPIESLCAMREINVLEILLPEIKTFDLIENLLDLEVKFSEKLIADPICRLAALSRGNLVAASTISKKLNFSKKQGNKLKGLTVSNSKLIPSYYKEKGRSIFYPLGHDYCVESVLLNWAENGGLSSTKSDEWEYFFKESKKWNPPKFTINGDDVISLGVTEGKAIGCLLSDLEKWWIQESFEPNRKDLLRMLKKMISNLT